MGNDVVVACPLCNQVASAQAGESPHLVASFPNTLLFVAQHQLFAGYCISVLREHVRDMLDLPIAQQQSVMAEVMASARAIDRAFTPFKMNYACYGNSVPHIHWHLIPRYRSDPHFEDQPWSRSSEFAEHATTPEIAREVICRLQQHL